MIRWLAAGVLFGFMFLSWFFSMIIDPYRDVEFGALRPGVPEFVESGASFSFLFTGLIAATLYSGEENRRGWRLWLTAPVLLFFAATSVWRWDWIVFHVLR